MADDHVTRSVSKRTDPRAGQVYDRRPPLSGAADGRLAEPATRRKRVHNPRGPLLQDKFV